MGLSNGEGNNWLLELSEWPGDRGWYRVGLSEDIGYADWPELLCWRLGWIRPAAHVVSACAMTKKTGR